jgi:deazaflavin-dependent oxidoreductase (nitroreductase family)
MNKKPSAWQELILRIYMLPIFTSMWPVIQYRIDALIFKLTGGKYSGTEALSGRSIIQLTTTGAKTGQARTMPLVSMFDGEKIALIASNLGQKNNPGWYYNLKAHPQCTVQFNGNIAQYMAYESEGDEREKYWNMAVAVYKGYELYRIRAAHRQIPVMVLEPAK